MLQQIRKTVAHSIILKIFLGAIIVSFVAWGVSDMLRGPSNQDMVTFNDLDPITYGDFTKEKALAAKRASQDGSTNPTEEGLETQDLSTIQNLITNKLLEYVAKLYDIEFSDTVAVNFIKSLEIFRNDNNEFDVEKFKNILKNEGYTETEYSKQIKNMMTRGTVMSSLIGNEYIPNKRIGNIVAHMSEIRTIDVASIPLSIKAKTQNTNFIDNDLKNFYNEHQDIFKSNELRDICYTKIDPTVVSHGITISDEEIKNFFTENKTDFANQTLKVASAQIKKTLLQTKINSSLVDISKELEDEVAGGSTLQEIATKYKLKRICVSDITSDNIETKADGLFVNFSTQLSEMSDKDVSYPFEIPNQDGFILFEIARLVPEHIRKFDDVKQEVTSRYAAFLLKQDLMKKLQNLASTNNSSNFVQDSIGLGMTITPNKPYVRAELVDNIVLPHEMLVAIFAAEKGTIMGPFVMDDEAYLFLVKTIDYDNKTKKRIAKHSTASITTKLQESMFEELTSYAQVKSNMKVKTNLSQVTNNQNGS